MDVKTEIDEKETSDVALDTKEQTIFDRIWERLEPLVSKVFKEPEPTSFEVVKGLDDNYYWVARHTNSFEDREAEILSEQAHDGYIGRLDVGIEPMPELWSWHTGGSRQGQADQVFREDHIVVAVGHFDDTAEGERARKFYEQNPGKIELSHGFTYPQHALKNGIYEVYNTFEISTLPIGAAANPYTTFEEVKAMALTDEKRQWLEQTIGKERTDKLVDDSQKMSKAVEELGAKYKDFADVVPDETPTEVKKPDDVGALAQLLSDILEGQAHVLSVVDGAGKAVQALQAEQKKSASLETRLATTEQTIKELQAELKLKPRAASKADETALSETEAAAVKADLPVEKDSFWST